MEIAKVTRNGPVNERILKRDRRFKSSIFDKVNEYGENRELLLV
jgi:hypothetical protein